MSTDRQTVLQEGVASSELAGRTAVRAVRCRVVGGEQDGETVSLGGRPLVIGAGKGAGLVLKDSLVSSKHAELQVVPEGVRVLDLGSTNGVFADKTKVTEAVVPVGTTLLLGDTTLHLVAADTVTLEPSSRTRFGGLIGESRAMREVFAILELASPSDATILLQGESGTGKELAARAIHDFSERASGPFVVLDCGAISESLIDSHFFGHKKGAFTGADSDRAGAFVSARGGTVFLDEIAELPLSSQVKLLRALEARTVQPVGSDSTINIDVRVVCATHRDLFARVQEGQFRHDLFHRLSVVHVQLPPLRQRMDDLAPLIRHFYEGRDIEPGEVDGDNLARMREHDWSGNVRELRNVLERSLVLSGGRRRFDELEIVLSATATTPATVDADLSYKEAKDAFEARYISEVLERAGGNVTHAAEHAGLSRKHLRDLLKKHGIER